MPSTLHILGRRLDTKALGKIYQQRLFSYWHSNSLKASPSSFSLIFQEINNASLLSAAKNRLIEIDTKVFDPYQKAIKIYQSQKGWLIGDNKDGASLTIYNSHAKISVWGASDRAFFAMNAAIIEALRYSGLMFFAYIRQQISKSILFIFGAEWCWQNYYIIKSH